MFCVISNPRVTLFSIFPIVVVFLKELISFLEMVFYPKLNILEKHDKSYKCCEYGLEKDVASPWIEIGIAWGNPNNLSKTGYQYNFYSLLGDNPIHVANVQKI